MLFVIDSFIKPLTTSCEMSCTSFCIRFKTRAIILPKLIDVKSFLRELLSPWSLGTYPKCIVVLYYYTTTNTQSLTLGAIISHLKSPQVQSLPLISICLYILMYVCIFLKPELFTCVSMQSKFFVTAFSVCFWNGEMNAFWFELGCSWIKCQYWAYVYLTQQITAWKVKHILLAIL